MVRRGGRVRFLAALGVLLAAVAVTLGLAASAASAALTESAASVAPARSIASAALAGTRGLAGPTKPATPNALQIAGADMPGGKVVIQAKTRPQTFATVLSEVSWLASATPQTSAPSSKSLGPKYTVTVFVKGKATQVYDLYPLAVGGPRAHRPAKQPSGKKTDGWFYGRLTMSESLRISGAPLKPKTDVVTGGVGGGEPTDGVASDVSATPSMDEMLGQLRQLVLLNGAVLVVIVAGLGGIAYLIRRRV